MDKERKKAVYAEIEKCNERLKIGIEKLHREMHEKGIPHPHKDERCKKPNQWIYTYPDGREELVEINDALQAVPVNGQKTLKPYPQIEETILSSKMDNSFYKKLD